MPPDSALVYVVNLPPGWEFMLYMIAFLCAAVAWRMFMGRW